MFEELAIRTTGFTGSVSASVRALANGSLSIRCATKESNERSNLKVNRVANCVTVAESNYFAEHSKWEVDLLGLNSVLRVSMLTKAHLAYK